MLDPLKSALSDFLHLSKDALHVHFGIAAYLFFLVFFRRRPASAIPWLAVLVLELINEALDIAYALGHRGQLLRVLLGTLKDVVNTMLWPTVLFLVLRWRAHRRRRGTGA